MIYYICNRPDKEKSLGNHCELYCFHGRPHKLDGCSADETCNVDCGFESNGNTTCKKSVMVKCRIVTKKELERYNIKL